MKPISIDTQKVLQFVPILNCTLLAVFFYNRFVLGKLLREEWKGILYMTAAGLFAQVPFRILILALPTAECLLQFLMQYVVCIVCGHILIKLQETW